MLEESTLATFLVMFSMTIVPVGTHNFPSLTPSMHVCRLLIGDFIVGPLLGGDLVFSISLLPVVCAVALMKVSMSQFLRMEVTAINPDKLPGVVASGGEDDPLLSGDVVVAISSSRPSAALMAATMS